MIPFGVILTITTTVQYHFIVQTLQTEKKRIFTEYKMVATGLVAAVAAPYVAAAALGAAGFTAAGVGVSTIAAGVQSGIGNVVAGSAFAGNSLT